MSEKKRSAERPNVQSRPNTPSQPEIMARQAVQAGAMLRQLRQSAGVDAMLLASALKVGLAKIQALEEGRLDDLPGLTFARGLATAVCRYFAADPQPVLDLMPQAMPVLRTVIDLPREPFRPSAFHTSTSSRLAKLRRRAGMPGWLLLVVAILLMGALVVWFVPGRQTSASGPQAAGGAVSAAAPTAAAASAATGAASGLVTEPALVSGAEGAPAAGTASQAMRAAPAQASTAAAPDQASALEPAALAASAPDAGQQGSGIVEQDVVSFDATGRVWVGVRDASGKWVLNRTLAKGDALSAGGELPLSVTVGDKTKVAVTVRGEPLDLSKHTRGGGTTARFTVDPTNP